MIKQNLNTPKLNPNPQLQKNEQKRSCCCHPYNIYVCYTVQNKMPVPLQHVHYNIKILKGLSVVEIQQTYSTQDYQESVNLEYLFIVKENAVLTKMIVELNGSKVYGIIKAKEEAQQQYEEGIKEGKTMAYCEQDIDIPEIKRVKIGQLAPGKQLKITFEYIQPLEISLNQFWKLEVSPLVDEHYTSLNHRQTTECGLICHDSSNDISIQIDTGSKITFVKSPTHSLLFLDAKNDQAKTQLDDLVKMQIALEDNPSNFTPNKQFVLLFSTEDINLPTSVLSHTNNDALLTQKYCATLTFIPKFNEIPIDDAYQQYLDGLNIVQNKNIKRGNYLFFIDRSGSMQGKRIQKAKESLILFLKSLSEGSLFNIISFGTTYRTLWTDSKIYNQETLDEAVKKVNQMDADMQGTEILKPLAEFVYNQKYTKKKENTLNIFIITDGEVTPKPIIDLVQMNNRAETRVYTLGIGEGCSQYLIKRLADVGNGKYQFVSDECDINEKVIDLLEDSLTPYLEQFTLDWNVNNVQQIIPNPQSIISLKKNQLFTVQCIFSAEQLKEDIKFDISFFDPQENKQIQCSVSLNLNNSIETDYYHKLAIHKFITSYENALRYGDQQLNFIKMDQQMIEDTDIENLSVEYQILSSKTAFICEVCDVEDQFKFQQRQKIKLNSIKQQINMNEKVSYALYRNPTSSYTAMNRSYQSRIASASYGTKCAEKKEECKMAQTRKKTSCVQKKQVDLLMEEGYQDEQISCLNQKQQELAPKQTLTYQELIQFAQADGSFIFPDNIKDTLEYTQIQNDQNLNSRLWDTLFALLYLEICCTAQKKSWQLVYQKGLQYLQDNGVLYKEIKNNYITQYSTILKI